MNKEFYMFTLLRIKNRVNNTFRNIKKYINDTKNVNVFENNNLKSYYLKYKLFQFFYNANNLLHYSPTLFKPLIFLFTFLQNKTDFKCDKICIEKMTTNGDRKIILNNICFSDAIMYINSKGYNNPINIKNQFMKFEATFDDYNTCSTIDTCENNETLNIKELLVVYRDENCDFDNTIENILCFNNIDSNNIKFNIVIFDKVPIKKEIKYNEIKQLNVCELYSFIFNHTITYT